MPFPKVNAAKSDTCFGSINAGSMDFERVVTAYNFSASDVNFWVKAETLG
jgi:hypothetical protein